VGYHLVRRGHSPTAEDLTTKQYVYEANFTEPYLILSQGVSPNDYDATRVLIYVDHDDIITSVVFG
jgi:hypothetical protein